MRYGVKPACPSDADRRNGKEPVKILARDGDLLLDIGELGDTLKGS